MVFYFSVKFRIYKKPVFIVWLDATGDDEWVRLEEAQKREAPAIKSMGYIIKATRQEIVMASHCDFEFYDVAGTWTIPRKMVVEIIPIKEPKILRGDTWAGK